jgi:hypothetical protein
MKQKASAFSPFLTWMVFPGEKALEEFGFPSAS